MTALEFNTKIEGLQDTLLSYTWKFTSNEEDAKDLVQDTLLKAMTYREKFVSNYNLKGWLYTIMKNTFINNYRKKVKSKIQSDLTENQYYLNQEDEYTFNIPDASLEYSDLQEGIENLDPKYNVPIRLYLTGYKYDEIAEELDLPLGTVKARIHKARLELKKNLPDYAY